MNPAFVHQDTSGPPLRFIVFHLNPISARLRFLKAEGSHVCLPCELPFFSDLLHSPKQTVKVDFHPSFFVHQCCRQWHLPEQHLKITSEFHTWIDTPELQLRLYPLQVTTYQPFVAPENTEWMELLECFSLIPLERELMREVYTFLLE